ncbi:hypothetical protein KEM60_02653 [Austwickia sp. TVS 96-490-7B]|nr:hypothetical protein [Austwickia sp. TVS 96-490-7B]
MRPSRTAGHAWKSVWQKRYGGLRGCQNPGPGEQFQRGCLRNRPGTDELIGTYMAAVTGQRQVKEVRAWA